MASSGVWENVFLTITPTFDGVCGMLFFIILMGFFAKFQHICQFLFDLLWPNIIRLLATTNQTKNDKYVKIWQKNHQK